MNSPNETILPKLKVFGVEPSHVEDERPGIIIQEDIELISSAIKTGIELMTFDKVIKKHIKLIQNKTKTTNKN